MTVWVVTITTEWPEDGGKRIFNIYGTREAAEKGANLAQEAVSESQWTKYDTVDIDSYPVIVDEGDDQ